MTFGLGPPGAVTMNQNHRTMNPRQFTRFFAALIVLALFGYVLVYWYLTSDIIVESFVEDIAPHEDVENMIGLKQITIDEACSSTTKRCYSVIDRLVEEDNGGDVFVERCLIVKGFEEESDSSVRLLPPPGEKFETSDSRMWRVDHGRITSQYVAAMAAAPFAFTSFSLDDRNEQKSVLEIGLGGGAFGMFMRKHRPNINITSVELDEAIVKLAKRWFAIEESATQRIVVADGTEFVKEAQRRGDKFDMVLLDACDTSSSAPCPAAVFLTSGVIEAISRIVNSNGIFVANILNLAGNEKDIDQIAHLFSKAFPTCAALHLALEVNVVLVCLPYKLTSPVSQLRFFETRIPAVVKHLDIEHLIQHFVISAPY